MSGEVGRRVLGKCFIGLTLGSERSRDLKMMNPYSLPLFFSFSFISSSFFFLFFSGEGGSKVLSRASWLAVAPSTKSC